MRYGCLHSGYSSSAPTHHPAPSLFDGCRRPRTPRKSRSLVADFAVFQRRIKAAQARLATSAADGSRVINAITMAPSMISPSVCAACSGSGSPASAHNCRQPLEHDFLVRDRQRPQAVIGLVGFSDRIDERAAEEILAAEPDLQRRPDAVETLARTAAGAVDGGQKPSSASRGPRGQAQPQPDRLLTRTICKAWSWPYPQLR